VTVIAKGLSSSLEPTFARKLIYGSVGGLSLMFITSRNFSQLRESISLADAERNNPEVILIGCRKHPDMSTTAQLAASAAPTCGRTSTGIGMSAASMVSIRFVIEADASYIRHMPRKPIELPPAVARAFVKDVRAFHIEPNAIKRDEIASRQLHALKQHYAGQAADP
jgi:hypothetical protein